MICPELRKHDICLMDVPLSKNKFTKIQLQRINAVREYFNVQYISEICEINGTHLAKGILYDYKAEQSYFRRNKAPKQKKPNNRSWKLWRELLKYLVNNDLSLKRPLGDWTKDHSKHGFWKSYLFNNQIYEYDIIEDEQQWRVY